LLLIPGLAMADLDIEEATFSDSQKGIRLSIPEGWTPYTQTGYPSMLLLLVGQQRRATISLVHGVLPPGKTLHDFTLFNAAVFSRLGLKALPLQNRPVDGRPIYELSASTQNGFSILQLYMAGQRQVFILTLSCPRDTLEKASSELRQLLQGVEITQPITPPPPSSKDLNPSDAPSRRPLSRPTGAPGSQPSSLPALEPSPIGE